MERLEPSYVVSAAGEPDYHATDWDAAICYIRGLSYYSRIAIDIWERQEPAGIGDDDE